VLTLSAANQANIKDRTKSPVPWVRLPNVTGAQWAMGDLDGYEPDLIGMGSISQAINPYGGLSTYGGFWFDLAEPQHGYLITTTKIDFETVEVGVTYEGETEIVRGTYIVDKTQFEGGILRIDCIHATTIKAKQYPQTKADATEYTTYTIPSKNNGKWIPATFGAPYRPRGLLVDYGKDAQPKWVFNEAVTGHAALGAAVADGWCFVNDDYLVVLTNEVDTTGATAGYIQAVTASKQLLSTDIIKDAVTGEWSSLGTDADQGVNQDTSDYAELDNPAASDPGASDNGATFRARLPDLSYPQGYRTTSAYFIGKIVRQSALNQGGRTLEHFDFGVEIIDGTTPADADLRPILTGTDTAFNNVDGADAETDIPWIPTPLQEAWSDDNDKGDQSFATSRLSNRYITILCWEQEAAGSPDDAQYFRIYSCGIRIQVYVPTGEANYHGNISGFDDDGSGTYTGGANALIEIPCDLLYFLLTEIWSDAFDTTAIAAARTAYDLGGGADYILAGQLHDPEQAEDLVDQIARQGMSYIFQSTDGTWKHVVFELPGATPDETFDQNAGDFIAANGPEVALDHSSSDQLYNQFEVGYGYDQGLQKFNDSEKVDESTAGAVGTWLTGSQSDWNVTRKLTTEAYWIHDATTIAAYRNYLIYKHADRKRIVTFSVGWNGLAMELTDTVQLNHSDLDKTAAGGADAHDYDLISIEEDLSRGIMTFVGFQSDVPNAAL
jgi:hypothetical protein